MFTTNKKCRPPALSKIISKFEKKKNGFNMRISLVKSDHFCHPSKCDLVRVSCMSKAQFAV